MAFWDRITGGIVGVGVGSAAADAIAPVLEVERQLAWASRAVRVLGPALVAEAAARQIPSNVSYADDAKRQGVGAARFELLTRLAYRFPGAPDLLTLRRRGIIDDTEATAALYRQAIPDPWAGRLLELRAHKLSPADVANAIQQGFIPNDGYLPAPPGGGPPFTIPVEQYAIPPGPEFAAEGIEGDHGRVLAELAGLPPGPETLLEMWRRSIITEGSVDAGIREGHTKSKWTPALKELRWNLLSAATLVNLRLRGWIDDATYQARMLVHGYGAAEAEDWYRSAGRPMAPVQAFTAFFRGAASPRDWSQPFDKQDFVEAIRRSDIRPEYTEPLWGIRHAYPSLFQLRRAVQEGSIGRARALTILKYERYEDADAAALVASWTLSSATTSGGLTAADLATEYEGGYITRADYINELVGLGFAADIAAAKATAVDARRARTFRQAAEGRIQRAFDLYRMTDTEALVALGELGIVADAAQHRIDLWRIGREHKSAVLTPSQIKKAYGANLLTQAEAITELEQRGYTPGDAGIFLAE